MATYTIPKFWSESRVQRTRRAVRWLVVILVPLFVIAFFLSLFTTGRPAELFHVLSIGSLAVLGTLWNFGRRNSYLKVAETTSINSVAIDLDGLRMNFATWSKSIPRKEITQVEEPPTGRGLYIRTHNKFSWYLIPRSTDRYEEMKGDLLALGVPIVQTSPPSNWGYLFVFPFCASLMCNILTQNHRILLVNFAVALVLCIAGTMITSFWTGDRRLRLKSMLGSFLPAGLSAVSLIFPFGIR